MTALTRAIVNHDLGGIESALAGDPTLAEAAENGWPPLRWAVQSGNLVTLVRFLRAADRREPSLDPATLLRNYTLLLADDEYEPYTLEKAVHALWADIDAGTTHWIGRFRRPFLPTAGHGDDLRFLIAWLDVRSPQELLRAIDR